MEPVDAAAWMPVAVALECQSFGRTDGCTFVQGALDHLDVVAVVPRAKAEVVLYLGVTQRQNDDLWLLRAVSEMPGAPAAFEQVATVDSRAPVDDQLAAFNDPLMRVLAPFVMVRVPEAVTVELSAPEGTEEAMRTTPFGLSAWIGGWGSWTAQYQDASLWTGGSAYLETPRDRAGIWANYDRTVEREPDLRVGRQRVPLAYDAESVAAGIHAAHNLDDHWAVGAVGRGGHDDPDGQYVATGRVHAGIERNWFPSDDERGNRLALGYLIGAQYDRYQQVNVLGETEAMFPTHLLLLEGEVQFDTVELNCDLSAAAELLRPDRRYVLSADGGTSLTLGDHVDLDLSMGITQQAVPGPASVDVSDFEQLKRASYAEPLQTWGNLNLRVHFDPTNGARNNRFEAAFGLDPTENL